MHASLRQIYNILETVKVIIQPNKLKSRISLWLPIISTNLNQHNHAILKITKYKLPNTEVGESIHLYHLTQSLKLMQLAPVNLSSCHCTRSLSNKRTQQFCQQHTDSFLPWIGFSSCSPNSWSISVMMVVGMPVTNLKAMEQRDSIRKQNSERTDECLWVHLCHCVLRVNPPLVAALDKRTSRKYHNNVTYFIFVIFYEAIIQLCQQAKLNYAKNRSLCSTMIIDHWFLITHDQLFCNTQILPMHLGICTNAMHDSWGHKIPIMDNKQNIIVRVLLSSHM